MNHEHEELDSGNPGLRRRVTELNGDAIVGVVGLAEYLSVSTSWVYDNHHRLGLPTIKLGQKLRFRISDIDGWLETQKRRSQ